MTTSTAGSLVKSASALVMSALTSASSVVSPSGSTTTALAPSAAACGKVRFSSSSATCEGAPGMEKLSLYLPPARPATAPSTTTAASQAASTLRWWR